MPPSTTNPEYSATASMPVTMIDAHEEVGRPRAEHRHGGERKQEAYAGGVGDVVEPREHGAEQRRRRAHAR